MIEKRFSKEIKNNRVNYYYGHGILDQVKNQAGEMVKETAYVWKSKQKNCKFNL